jgi:thiol-disulfide isomerase/thioredoxin
MRDKTSRRSVLGLVISATAARLFAIDTREPAGKFKAKTLDGEAFSNDVIAGRVTLIQFWATWCPYCRSDQPAVDAMVEEFGSKGLVVLAVDVGESRKKVKQYLEKSPRLSKIVLTEDTNLAAWYAAKAYPYYVLIDRNGKIAGTHKGAGGEGCAAAAIAQSRARFRVNSRPMAFCARRAPVP